MTALEIRHETQLIKELRSIHEECKPLLSKLGSGEKQIFARPLPDIKEQDVSGAAGQRFQKLLESARNLRDSLKSSKSTDRDRSIAYINYDFAMRGFVFQQYVGNTSLANLLPLAGAMGRSSSPQGALLNVGGTLLAAAGLKLFEQITVSGANTLPGPKIYGLEISSTLPGAKVEIDASKLSLVPQIALTLLPQIFANPLIKPLPSIPPSVPVDFKPGNVFLSQTEKRIAAAGMEVYLERVKNAGDPPQYAKDRVILIVAAEGLKAASVIPTGANIDTNGKIWEVAKDGVEKIRGARDHFISAEALDLIVLQTLENVAEMAARERRLDIHKARRAVRDSAQHLLKQAKSKLQDNSVDRLRRLFEL